MHHPLQCVEPNWNSCFCVDPVLSINTRKNFLSTHNETQALVMPAHFPTPGAGHITEFGNTYKFKFSENRVDILIGVIGLLLVIEATRRAIGWAVPILASIFLSLSKR